jgi:hypothetical protein
VSTISVQSQRGLDVFMRKGKRTFASRKRKIAGLCALVLAGVIGVGAYAFTASNTVPEQAAGAGANTVTGYTEVGASYTWSANGEYITGAEIKLTATKEGKVEPSDVAVALSKETGKPPTQDEWADCPTISVLAAEKEWLVKCVFLANEGAHTSLTGFTKAYSYTAKGVPDAEGNELTVAAVSEGVAIVE